jgi:hypothetical protein
MGRTESKAIAANGTVPANDTARFEKRVTSTRFVSLVTVTADTADAVRFGVRVERADGTRDTLVTAADSPASSSDTTDQYPVLVPTTAAAPQGRLLAFARLEPDDTLVMEFEEYAGTTGGVTVQATAASASTRDVALSQQ